MSDDNYLQLFMAVLYVGPFVIVGGIHVAARAWRRRVRRMPRFTVGGDAR